MAQRVRVKAKPGRVVRESPHGDMIPDDRYITVPLTSYINRLLNHWGDLELEPKAEAKPKATTAKAETAEPKKEG